MKLRKLHSDFLAVFLILSEPYLEFAHQHQFMFEATNLLVLSVYVAVALAIAALLTRYPNRLLGSVLFTASIIVFLDLRLDLINSQEFQILYVVIPALVIFWIAGQNTSKILFVLFGVMLIVALLPPAYPRTHKADALQVANQPGENLPVYVHIILDEQIGVEGIGSEIRGHKEAKTALKEFFIPNGFRLFGRAYSEFYYTNDSIPSMLNFKADENPSRFYSYNKVQDRNVVFENDYFSSLFAMGYKIRIYQTVWMDYCKSSIKLIDFCLTYKASGVSRQALEKLDQGEILDVRLAIFWKKSFIKEKLHSTYTNVSTIIQRIGLPMPNWVRLDHIELGPIPVLPVFDTLINDVSQATPGTMFFAHIILPHSPYAVGSDCSIRRPVFSWKRFTPSQPLMGELQNTFESRQERYDDYFEQTNCALTKLSELVERMKSRGIFDDAIILVHGDHGSRIGLILPNIQNINRLPPREFYDGFSTLFTVKAPQFTAGYDLTMLPLTQLLRRVAKKQLAIPEKTDGHFVYIRDNQDSSRLRVPMPEIPGAEWLSGLSR